VREDEHRRHLIALAGADLPRIFDFMTATQVIAEIDRLPPEERKTVFQHVHELEESMIPDSFRTGMEEAARGEVIEMQDEHFTRPPQ
jgi:hypothetical protein